MLFECTLLKSRSLINRVCMLNGMLHATMIDLIVITAVITLCKQSPIIKV